MIQSEYSLGLLFEVVGRHLCHVQVNKEADSMDKRNWSPDGHDPGSFRHVILWGQALNYICCGGGRVGNYGPAAWDPNERCQPSWRVETEIHIAFACLAKLCTLGGAASAQKKKMHFSAFPRDAL